MTFDSGAFSHHSAEGAYRLASQRGIPRMTSQKNGAINATIA